MNGNIVRGYNQQDVIWIIPGNFFETSRCELIEIILRIWGIIPAELFRLPSGKHTKNYRKSQFLMGKSTINDHFQ